MISLEEYSLLMQHLTAMENAVQWKIGQRTTKIVLLPFKNGKIELNRSGIWKYWSKAARKWTKVRKFRSDDFNAPRFVKIWCYKVTGTRLTETWTEVVSHTVISMRAVEIKSPQFFCRSRWLKSERAAVQRIQSILWVAFLQIPEEEWAESCSQSRNWIHCAQLGRLADQRSECWTFQQRFQESYRFLLAIIPSWSERQTGIGRSQICWVHVSNS